MHAMDFYVSTCRCVMLADAEVPESWAELYRLLPCLRQSLSCYVCFQLLLDPMGPDHNVCKHSVCKQCVGGKMKLKPSCSWCKDYWDFVPNTLMKILVSCFKKLCVYIYNCPIGRSICNSSLNGETNNLANILKEVIAFDDQYLSPHSSQGADVGAQDDELVSEATDAPETPDTALVKPGCSSDDDVQKLQTDNSLEEIQETDTCDKPVEDSPLPLRRTFRSSIKFSNKESTKTEVKSKMQSKQKLPKRELKTNIFMKRTAHGRRKCFIRRKIVGKRNKKRPVPVSKFYPVRTRKDSQAPVNLEKVDDSEPLAKKLKRELQPPELKPPSFCKCGKSGNYNQLTCLGQRCPCYSMKLPCIGCKCKGCRNPKKGPNSQTSSVRCMSDLWSGCSRTSASVS